MHRFESVRVNQLANGVVEIEPIVIFTFTETVGYGLLKTRMEYNIVYSKHDKKWSGDVIDSDGWHDISEEAVNNLVAYHKLERMI